MTLSEKQAFVLANIDRVIPLAAKINVTSQRPRYQLDGTECTAQITGLTVKGLISKHPNGGFRRRAAIEPVRDRVGERQAPVDGFLEGLRAMLSSP